MSEGFARPRPSGSEAGAPVVYETWRSGQLQQIDRANTFAEGLATRVAFSLPAQILWQRLDDFRLVTDEEMRRGILSLLETARVLAARGGQPPAEHDDVEHRVGRAAQGNHHLGH